MKISEIGELIKDSSLVSIRCGSCLRIIVSKDKEEFWIAPFKHNCWQDWKEVEVDRRWIGGVCGEMITVYPMDKELRKELIFSIYREEEVNEPISEDKDSYSI